MYDDDVLRKYTHLYEYMLFLKKKKKIKCSQKIGRNYVEWIKSVSKLTNYIKKE